MPSTLHLYFSFLRMTHAVNFQVFTTLHNRSHCYSSLTQVGVFVGAPQSVADADGRRKSLQWLRAILPRDPVERRVLGTVGFVRLILMPMASMAIVGALAALGALPNDPICRLVLLVEGSMPTAQNLVLLMNLNENTQPLASRTGKLLLRLYPIAILPVTVWMTLFVQRMPVALAAL